jgi:hypothetical protein
MYYSLYHIRKGQFWCNQNKTDQDCRQRVSESSNGYVVFVLLILVGDMFMWRHF